MMGKYGLCPEMWEHPEIHIRIRWDRGQEQGVISAVTGGQTRRYRPKYSKQNIFLDCFDFSFLFQILQN